MRDACPTLRRESTATLAGESPLKAKGFNGAEYSGPAELKRTAALTRAIVAASDSASVEARAWTRNAVAHHSGAADRDPRAALYVLHPFGVTGNWIFTGCCPPSP